MNITMLSTYILLFTINFGHQVTTMYSVIHNNGYIDQKPNKFQNPVDFASREPDFIYPYTYT